ncbi:MAG: hypothetical protein NTX59_07330 [Elusimicrobia bacterium]|nr:hypothetical protein [Elusimicrobiota bacterium]
MRIILILIFLLPAAARAGGARPYYFIEVQNGAYNFKGGMEQLEDSHKVLREMVKLADARHVRLTLMFSAQYADYISSDPVRLTELESWKQTGHEIGAFHQGPDTKAWDGYCDLTGEALELERKRAKTTEHAGTHLDYFAALSRLAAEIKTGCMMDKVDKKFLAAAPEYEACPGPDMKMAGAGKAGKVFEGVNEFLASAGGPGKGKKRLSCSHPADKAGIEASKKAFSGMESGAYCASFKSSPSEFGAFYAWLGFLKDLDPEGLRSRTVAGIVEEKILPEKKAMAGPKKPDVGVEKPYKPALPEDQRTQIPRLKPIHFSQADIVPSIRRIRWTRPVRQHGYCGDGICDAFERAHPGRCPQDCGR